MVGTTKTAENLSLFKAETSRHISTTAFHLHCQHLSYTCAQTQSNNIVYSFLSSTNHNLVTLVVVLICHICL